MHLTFFPIVIYYSARAVSLVKFVPCKSVKQNIELSLSSSSLLLLLLLLLLLTYWA